MGGLLKCSLKLNSYLIVTAWVILINFAAKGISSGGSRIHATGSKLDSSFRSCLARTNVDISYPLNETWWYDSQSNSFPTLRHPIAVAYAQTTLQVQELVKCATHHNIKINPRSGGHSYEAFCNEDSHLVIDVSLIDFVNINNDKKTATVGGGVRLGRLFYELGIHQMSFPAGDCQTIGLGGHVGAGGLGFLGRLWGLAADNVLELEAVDWRGHVLVANAETNEDLYFALRGGGGGSYGIITKVKLKIYPNPPLSTAFIIRWNHAISASDFSKALFKWKPWDNMPPEMTSVILYRKSSGILWGIYAIEDGHLGLERILNDSGFLEIIPEESREYYYFESKDLLRARAWADNIILYNSSNSRYNVLNVPSSFIFESLKLPPYPSPVHPTWAQIQNDTRVNATHPIGGVGTTGPILGQEPPLLVRDALKHTSQVFVKEFDKAAYEALDTFLSHNGTSANFYPLGGKVSGVPEDFNAFPHRRQPFFSEFTSPYNPTGIDPASALAEQNEILTELLIAMEPYTNHRSYQGCPDLFWTTDPKKYMPQYYGNNVKRLIRTKVKYDPRDFFSNKQSTPKF